METMKQANDEKTHEYFRAHKCYLSADQISAFNIKCGPVMRYFHNLRSVNAKDIRALSLYRSHTALCKARYHQFMQFPLSIHPYSRLRFELELVFVLGMIASNCLLAIHYAARDPEFKHHCIMYAIDSLYIFNVVANFFTGYVEGNANEYAELNLRKISCRYARTWLMIDVISSMCIVPGLIAIRNVVAHLLLVSMKIFRLPIIMVYANNVMTVMRIGVIKRSVVESFVLILSYLSWNMYFQFAVEYMIENDFMPQSPRNCSWISLGNLWNQTTPIRLAYAFDRAVGMLRKSANLNVIIKDGCYELFCVVSWIISKLLVYHCALKYITALFGAESARSKYYSMMKQVETYMSRRKFPPRIKKKILKFYAIRFQSNFFVESHMLECVSGQLREDIVMHTGRQLVRELDFLKHLPRPLLLQIGIKLRIVIFIAGDIIFKINTVGDCLYFIDKGCVAIYSESGKEICHLEDGDYFGEIALVMKSKLRTASAVAVTNCELFRLDREDFDNTIAMYPTVYEEIKKLAINRLERTAVLDEHHKIEIRMAQEYKLAKINTGP